MSALFSGFAGLGLSMSVASESIRTGSSRDPNAEIGNRKSPFTGTDSVADGRGQNAGSMRDSGHGVLRES